jgi:hypothetical protein
MSNRSDRTIVVDSDVYRELQYMVELHREHGAANPMTSVEQLVGFVLASVADASRRPGAWERQLLESMGLVANCVEHETYRERYGKPSDA